MSFSISPLNVETHRLAPFFDKENVAPREEEKVSPETTAQQDRASRGDIKQLIRLAQESWERDAAAPPNKKPRLEEDRQKNTVSLPLVRTLSEETIIYCQDLKQKMEEAMKKRLAVEEKSINETWKKSISASDPALKA